MKNMYKKLLPGLLFVIFVSLLSLPVYAQYQSSDYTQSIATTLLGTLPTVCIESFGSPQCVSCIGSLKLLPLVFFTTVFYFILYTVILHTFARPSEQTPIQQLMSASHRDITKGERKIAMTIALILALVFLHSTQLEKGITQIGMWIQIFLFIFAIIFVRSILQASGAFGIISILITFIIFWWLWGSMAGPVVTEWIGACV